MKAALTALAGAALVAASPAIPSPSSNAPLAVNLFQFYGASGYDPEGGIISDRGGTLYGTTTIGGTGPCSGGAGCGSVYSLAPPVVHGGRWVFEKLYDFQGGQDGESPFAPLTLGAGGTLYGYPGGGTPGTVFSLAPPDDRAEAWSFKILYVFANGRDGNLLSVTAPLVWRRGALFGVASGGDSQACGAIGCGSVFRLTPGADGGPWIKKTLFTFTGGATSGQPNWIVGFGGADGLFVSTSLGHGAVVELTPTRPGRPWAETVLTRFAGGVHGEDPSHLVLGADGTVFGLAVKSRAGLAFQLAPPAKEGGSWTRTTIADVSDHGWGPVSLAARADGVLIGAVGGDPDFFAGSVFTLTPPTVAGDPWTYAEVWNFTSGPDRNPVNVVTGRNGRLFSVLTGGDSSNGSLVELP